MNSPAKYLSAEARRAATVEAVIQLAAQTPPSEITTTAIAQHMGVTQGALFKHFPTKEAILEAVMVWVAEHLLSRVDEAEAKQIFEYLREMQELGDLQEAGAGAAPAPAPGPSPP